MKSNSIVQVISEICTYQHLEIESHPLLSLQSIRNHQSCSNCENLLVVINQLGDRIVEISNKHNKLLAHSKKLIDLNYQLFSQQQTKFEETVVQYQQDIAENQSKIKQLESVIDENGKTIWQYRNLLLEKDQIIAEMEEKVDKIEKTTKQRYFGSPSQEIQVLKHHKRQKSQLCSKLQTQNVNIQYENSRLKQQNQKLADRIAQLSEYVIRMEQDLANMNIKSPRMLKQFIDPQQITTNKILNEISRCSIDGESPIHENDPSSKKYEVVDEQEPQRISLSSSYGANGRVLRDVLNISGQTSKYFNFHTKQKFNQLNAYLIRDNSSQNNENDLNVTNRAQDRKDQRVKIMEIKQFEVHEAVESKKQTQKTSNNKEIKEQSPCIMIDPYYAYFVLTIQCLKMNWRNLDEVANISLLDQWDTVIGKQIPINKWGEHLKELMISKINA